MERGIVASTPVFYALTDSRGKTIVKVSIGLDKEPDLEAIVSKIPGRNAGSGVVVGEGIRVFYKRYGGYVAVALERENLDGWFRLALSLIGGRKTPGSSVAVPGGLVEALMATG